MFQMGFRLTTSPIPKKLKEKLHNFIFFFTVSHRETKTASASGKVLSPRGGSGRPKTSPKEASSPRRLVSRKELERSATELEITKKETQPRSAHAVSIDIYALAF